jgi:hypothetical protein
MTFSLSEVSFTGAWRPFFATLPGWREVERGLWAGQGALAPVDPEKSETTARLEIRDLVAGDAHIRLSRTEVARIPGGAPRLAAASEISNTSAVLNHVAIDVPEADEVVASWLHGSGVSCFLPKAGRFDPSAGKTVVAEHLVGSGNDYVTIRYLPDIAASRLSHVGFQFASADAFMAHQRILQAVGWPILVGPEEIDGSLVTHFAGPDGMVHDLFHVLEPDGAKQ